MGTGTDSGARLVETRPRSLAPRPAQHHHRTDRLLRLYGPRRTRLVDLARVAGARWAVEECVQQAKNEAGLDEYQVRDWRAWYAHITLAMAAYAWLVVARSLAVKGELVPANA
ncbi:hypothetical protein GCM10022225_51130 [Plantactinospora mayteni]|uniref:Transposase n=1 Tax=Plantactinospora mayteni TaxID=566021 RepID=A0ABQ4F468_9ACTN|nr:hypothetical protein Pma05_82800 [Plantactinospora mayteni]